MDNKRVNRIKVYSAQIGMLFNSAVDEILRSFKGVPELQNGTMFSFESLSRSKQIEIENKFRNLHSVVKLAIENGIKLEWDNANIETDKLIKSILGKLAEDGSLAGWFDRNTKARNAFIRRTDNGLNLSDRIWKPVKQLREEMEIALTVAIGEGDSASTISRKVRKYLEDPDLMFRRFRYKAGVDKEGNPIYKTKWKKRVRMDNGTYIFVDYDKDSYKTGTGVYKSASRNAMRVARTETNMAYRRADNARWQNLDFILGQEVKTVREHDDEDICDELAGKYPKDFLFDGWHPQCMCYSNPIMIDEDEFLAMAEAKRKGEPYISSQKPIEEMPENFQNWVLANKESIKKKRAEGKEPYFIRNNAEAVDKIMANEQPLTTLEKAELRHKARTKEQEDDIKNRWEQRKKNQRPRTILELENAIENYKYADESLREEEYEINRKMKALFDNNDYGMDVRHEYLESIIEKGFLNTFQTGTSNGYLGSSITFGDIEENHRRLVISHKMFIPSTHKYIIEDSKNNIKYTGKQLNRSEYEKYGHLLDRDKSDSYNYNLTPYGDVQVRFNKEKVLCTWTFDDSLLTKNEYYQPSLTSNPKIESFDKKYSKYPDDNVNWNSLYKWQDEMLTDYIELQYHGNLTIEMVESMTFGDIPNKVISNSLLNRLKEKGIEIWYRDKISRKVIRYSF